VPLDTPILVSAETRSLGFDRIIAKPSGTDLEFRSGPINTGLAQGTATTFHCYTGDREGSVHHQRSAGMFAGGPGKDLWDVL
jgi:hypothetical protein